MTTEQLEAENKRIHSKIKTESKIIIAISSASIAITFAVIVCFLFASM